MFVRALACLWLFAFTASCRAPAATSSATRDGSSAGPSLTPLHDACTSRR
jgi:hypothetical protein